jgi:hypothetical protein
MVMLDTCIRAFIDAVVKVRLEELPVIIGGFRVTVLSDKSVRVGPQALVNRH